MCICTCRKCLLEIFYRIIRGTKRDSAAVPLQLHHSLSPSLFSGAAVQLRLTSIDSLIHLSIILMLNRVII